MDRTTGQHRSIEVTGKRSRAMSELLADQWPRLKRFIRYQCGPLMRRKEPASDLAQSACREALERWTQFRGDPEALRRWLFEIARRKIVTRRRYWGRQRRDAAREASNASPVDAPAMQATPSEATIADEQTRRLVDALSRLSERDRTTILLARFDGLSHAEIAVSLQCSEPAARQQLARSLARLEHLLR
jgi:RNA polymerase sigma-70 factor (ECF subfamily)